MASFKTIAIIPVICLTLLLGWFCFIQFNATSNGVLEHQQQVDDKPLAVGNQRVFDFFLLSLQWPATYCRNTNKCCKQNGCCRGPNSPTRFTIHGLWTDYNDGSWPSCCNGPAFNETQISTLYYALNTYWPTLSCSKTSTCHGKKGLFWAHEWEKHGTCSFPIFQDEYDYFVKTLHLYFKYNVTEVLIEAGYVPSNTEKYSLEGIRSAIKTAYNSTPDIECSGNAIVEVHLCFYKDFKPRDCDATSSLDTSCSEYVSLPEFASIGLKSNGTATTWHSRKSSA